MGGPLEYRRLSQSYVDDYTRSNTKQSMCNAFKEKNTGGILTHITKIVFMKIITAIEHSFLQPIIVVELECSRSTFSTGVVSSVSFNKNGI